MKTKIHLYNIVMRFGFFIVGPIAMVGAIYMFLTEEFSFTVFLVLVGTPTFAVFGYVFAIKEGIYFDIRKKQVIVNRYPKYFAVIIPFSAITEIEITHDKLHKKNNFVAVFSKDDKKHKIYFSSYNWTLFGKRQSKKTIEIIKAWNEKLKELRSGPVSNLNH